MQKRNLNNRAFTIVELAIVLAVTAIVATMVVSFTTLVSGRREIAQAKLDALNDIKIAETMIEAWIESEKPTVSDVGNADGITYENKTLRVGDKTFTLDRVIAITFKAETNSNNIIYFCTVTYELPDKVENYTFCVNAQGVSGGSV